MNESRALTLTDHRRRSPEEVRMLYQQLTLAYFAEAYHLRRGDIGQAEAAEQVRNRTNAQLLGAL